MEDIESVCNDQLEGQSIYNDSLEMAIKFTKNIDHNPS